MRVGGGEGGGWREGVFSEGGGVGKGAGPGQKRFHHSNLIVEDTCLSYDDVIVIMIMINSIIIFIILIIQHFSDSNMQYCVQHTQRICFCHHPS